MEINLNGNNFGIGRDFGAIQTQAASGKTEVAAKTASKIGVRTSELDVLKQSEPVMEVPESALVRDDDLGVLVGKAFNLPPPPMPDFARMDA